LLKSDGIIFVQCDENEQAYLKVLMDEIFGREKYCNTIVWRKVKSAKIQSSNLPNISEYVLCYAISDQISFNEYFLPRNDEKDKKLYRYIEEETGRLYRLSDFTQKGQGEPKYFGDKLLFPPDGKHWIWSQERIDEGMKKNLIVFSQNGIPSVKRYLDEKEGIPLGDLWIDDDVQIISSTSNERENFDGQKPESLIKRIILLASQKGDYVLDFHLGTGSTAAVAIKMKRHFIGIEQMDYINSIVIPRLERTISGEQSGISKDINWTGGGSFVYCELAERSETLMKQLQSAEDSQSILNILDKATEKGLLRPSVLPDDLKKTREDFLEFSLDEQRRLVMELLDKNKLYVNLCDMEDENMGLSESSKAFTRSFYSLDRDTEV